MMVDVLTFLQFPLLSLDFETGMGEDGESPIGMHGDKKKIELFSLAAKKGNRIIAASYEAKDWPHFYKALKKAKITIVFHNAKFDLSVIKAAGGDIHSIRFEDTMIMAHLLDENRPKKLKVLRQTVLGKKERAGWKDIDKSNKREYMAYNKEDAIDTLELYYIFRPMITAEDLEVVYELEKQVVYPTLEMEYYGVKVDAELLVKQDMMLGNFMEKIQDKVDRALGQKLLGKLSPPKRKKDIGTPRSLNLSSSPQMQKLFYQVLRYPPKAEWRTKTGWSMRSAVLEDISRDRRKECVIARKLATMIAEWRMYEKTKSAFTTPFLKKKDEKDYIYGSFNSLGTTSGRYSASTPNLQQLSRDPFIPGDLSTHLRSLFICENDEYLIGIDYSQIELRMMAELSKDKNMCQAFLEGKDIHQATADAIHCERALAKTINFGTTYGQGPQGLSQLAGISMKKAIGFIEAFWRVYSGVSVFFRNIKKSTEQVGYVRSISGRKRRFYGQFDQSIGRQASNMPIQGGSADLIKLAMVLIYRIVDHKKVRFVMQVHDELIFACVREYAEEAREIIQYCLEHVIRTHVPLVAEPKIGLAWAQLKS